MSEKITAVESLKPRIGEILLIEAKSVEVDLAYLSKHWKSLRIEKTPTGVSLFVKKREKTEKDIYKLGEANHPFCRNNEYLAFRPSDEGIDVVFEGLYRHIHHRNPDKRARAKWFDGLTDNGVRVIKDPYDPRGRSLLVFLSKRWKTILKMG